MRLTETVDDPKREPVSELVPGHPQTRLFLFCFGVFFIFFNPKANHACFLTLTYDKAMLKRLLSILTSYKLLYSMHLLSIRY